MGSFVPSAQFCCEPKNALKNSRFKKNLLLFPIKIQPVTMFSIFNPFLNDLTVLPILYKNIQINFALLTRNQRNKIRQVLFLLVLLDCVAKSCCPIAEISP